MSPADEAKRLAYIARRAAEVLAAACHRTTVTIGWDLPRDVVRGLAEEFHAEVLEVGESRGVDERFDTVCVRIGEVSIEAYSVHWSISEAQHLDGPTATGERP